MAKDIIAVALNKTGRKPPGQTGLISCVSVSPLGKIRLPVQVKKPVYLRIIRPDQLVIAISPDNLFDFGETKMVFTESRSVDYMNQDIDMCIFVDNTGDFIPGNYTAELYLEGNMIGTTKFMLTGR
jgi:hypothetical protein